MYKMTHETMSWVERLRGETRQEIAEAVSKVAGIMPDDADIVDETGKVVGAWSSLGFSHSPTHGKPAIRFFDNRRGAQSMWHTECSKAVCVSQ